MHPTRSPRRRLPKGRTRASEPVLLGLFAGTAIGLGTVLTLGFGAAPLDPPPPDQPAPQSTDQPAEARPQLDLERAAELAAGAIAPKLLEAAERLESDASVLRTAVDRLEHGAPPEEVIRDLSRLRSPIDELFNRPIMGEGQPGRNWRDERRDRVGDRMGDRVGDRGGERQSWMDGDDARPPVADSIDPAKLRAFVEEHLGDTIPDEAKSLLDTDRFWNAMAEGPRGQRLRELVETMDQDPDLGHAKIAEFRATIRVAQATGLLRRVLSTSDAPPDALENAKAELVEAMGAQFDALSQVREIEIQRLSERLETMMFQLRNDTNSRDETIARHAEERIERMRQFVRGKPPRD